jgi:hypothetical protein
MLQASAAGGLVTMKPHIADRRSDREDALARAMLNPVSRRNPDGGDLLSAHRRKAANIPPCS